jgi:hypothetical protein
LHTDTTAIANPVHSWRNFFILIGRTFDVMSPRHCDENEKQIEMIMGG